jgi:hypothetical protein
MTSLAEKILDFNKHLHFPGKTLPDVKVMTPYQDQKIYDLCHQFYNKYYNDNNPRYLIIGINPGRFGAGTTGIPFTDPRKLEEICGIKNEMAKKVELSADFIYAMIDRYGGARKFYSEFLFSSVSPLGFTRNGKNLNYYDDKKLEKAITPFAVSCIHHQLDFGLHETKCFCLGEGKNYEFLRKLNETHGFFDNIIPLPHPRFIMQYKRKHLNEYFDLYLEKLKCVSST